MGINWISKDFETISCLKAIEIKEINWDGSTKKLANFRVGYATCIPLLFQETVFL